MTAQTRLANVLQRLATATSVQRAREFDSQRAARNGHAELDQRLEAVVSKLEASADELWAALNLH